jgi:gliding motility-associated-like protein
MYPDAEIEIYDRYGKLLIRYHGSDLGWDGTYRGIPQPSTDYWYIINIGELDKRAVGHFTLKR